MAEENNSSSTTKGISKLALHTQFLKIWLKVNYLAIVKYSEIEMTNEKIVGL